MRLFLVFLIGVLTLVGCIVAPAYVNTHFEQGGMDYITFFFILLIGTFLGVFSSLKQNKNDNYKKRTPRSREEQQSTEKPQRGSTSSERNARA